MKTISFKNFWSGFDYTQHSAFNWIVDIYKLNVVKNNADIVVYCTFGDYIDDSYKNFESFPSIYLFHLAQIIQMI